MKLRVHKWKVFNKKTARRVVGLQFAGAAMALSLITYPTHAFEYRASSSLTGDTTGTVVTTTQTQYQFPLEATTGMSQGYRAFHAAVDLRAPKGTRVYAIDGGTVVEVEEMVVGYGHFVRIAHAGTISSLYAHLDLVNVKPGDKVERGQTLGTVGVTGWTTGPHLHFEVYQANKAVNPMVYISDNQKSQKTQIARQPEKSESRKSI